MSKVHILEVDANREATVTCPAHDEFCQGYVECHDEECDVEKLSEMAFDEGDDQPVLHGVTHYVLPWCFGVKADDECFVAGYHDLGALADEFLADNGLGPGKYLVQHAIDGDEGGIAVLELVTSWRDVRPQDAPSINLNEFPDTNAPQNEEGERCPWPWEPQQLVGVPLGQFHCGYCGAMSAAGIPHPDYTGFAEEYEQAMRTFGAVQDPVDLSDPFSDRPPS